MSNCPDQIGYGKGPDARDSRTGTSTSFCPKCGVDETKLGMFMPGDGLRLRCGFCDDPATGVINNHLPVCDRCANDWAEMDFAVQNDGYDEGRVKRTGEALLARMVERRP